MAYFEGDIPVVTTGYNNNNGWNDWSWIIGLAVVGGIFGNGGFGFGGGNRGNCATQADLSAGFANSAVLSNLNDIILGQANAINYNNQGFAGLNQTITNGFADLNTALCGFNYNVQGSFNSLSHQLAQCCCDTRSAIADVKYANERNTCELINVSNANTKAIIDYLTNEKIEGLRAENTALKGQISNDRQSAYIIDALAPKCPQPAYVVQPAQPVTFPTNCCGNVAYANFGYNGCGASVL